MATFYHIYFDPKPGVNDQEVKKQFNLALDWYRYEKNCWIVRTSVDAARWQARLRPLVEPEGSLLIFKLDPSQRQGWMPKGFWDWLKNAEQS